MTFQLLVAIFHSNVLGGAIYDGGEGGKDVSDAVERGRVGAASRVWNRLARKVCRSFP